MNVKISQKEPFCNVVIDIKIKHFSTDLESTKLLK